MKRFAIAVALMISFVVAVTTAGCVSVPAYERELLAHPAMEGEDDGSWTRFESHIAGARESALQPGTSGGGGCGCN